MELFAFTDDSGEIIDDLDDLDDIAFITPVNSLPFSSRRPTNNVRVASPTVFNTPANTVRQVQQQPQFVQIDQSSSRAPSTCTCTPQTTTFNRFQPSVTPARQLVQFMRFPQQQSVNRFIQPSGSFFNMFNPNQFPGVQFILDD